MKSKEITWKGAEQLRENLIAVDKLVRHPRNPRRGQIALIAESLDRFGQVRPILTDGTQIVAGNHTYLAALELGWTHVAAIQNEFSSEAEARAYLLADNRLPELGTYDNEQLLSLLSELESIDGWTGTGYTADDLDDLRALQDAVPETDHESFTGGFAATEEELAARAATLQAGQSLSEVVLLLTQAQGEEFETHIKILRKAYGDVGGVTELVDKAIESQASKE